MLIRSSNDWIKCEKSSLYIHAEALTALFPCSKNDVLNDKQSKMGPIRGLVMLMDCPKEIVAQI